MKQQTTLGQLKQGQSFTFGSVNFIMHTHCKDDLCMCYIAGTRFVVYISNCVFVVPYEVAT